MNKQRKRHISKGKFDRVAKMAVMPMHINNFSCYDDGVKIMCYVVNGYMYWTEQKYLTLHDFNQGPQYYRKSIQDALS